MRSVILLCLMFLLSSVTQAFATDYYFGADLSYVNEMEDCGAVYREKGQKRDPYAILKDHGGNLVRIRIWNNPDWTKYSNLADVKRSIARAKALGLQTLLDFHYSDDWADGDKQIMPKAWEAIKDDKALAQALYQFTYDTLAELDREKLMPEMVQVGNETNPELLGGKKDKPINWTRNALLLNAGIKGVRDAGAKSQIKPSVMLHIAQPENVEPWFAAATKAGVTDYDFIGVSYYRKWSSQTLDGLSAVLGRVDKAYKARVILVETAYPWTMGFADNAPNLLGRDTLIDGYPATPEGQKKYMDDLTRIVLTNGGVGVVYWEPAWVSTKCSTRWGRGSHWENATFFDFKNGNELLPAIDFMRPDPSLMRRK